MSALDDIRQRAEEVARWREHFFPPLSKIDFSQRDVPRLLGALDAVLALADTYTKEFTAHNEAESMLRASAYHIRAAVNDALEAGK